MYGPYGTYIPGPGPAPATGYGTGPDPDPTGYGMWEAPVAGGAYRDTYRPAYEQQLLPRQASGETRPGPGPRESGSREPGLREPGLWEAGLRGPGLREPGLRDPGLREPGLREPGLRGPGLREAGLYEAGLYEAGPREPGLRAASQYESGLHESGLRPRSDRRAARRRRERNARRSESAMRRLVPQALVVAFLAGGTTAFVANDKAVELNVDGKARTLHTFADDVNELLAEEDLPVGAHDQVTPGRDAELESGDQVTVDHGRPVRLTLDGRRHEVWTTARTVEGMLGRLGVRAEGAYLSVPRSRPIGRSGLTLDVRTERAVTVIADGRARVVRTNAATVREAVHAAGVTLRAQDTTSVPLGSFPRDGQTVTVLRVTGAKEVREELIPFQVSRTDDPSLFRGIEVVDSAGQPGVRRVTYLMRTVNGVRQKPRRERAEVVREPRTQLVRVGVKPPPPSVDGAEGLNWRGLAACESGGRPAAVDPSGTYGGLYQFDTRTWHGLGGKGHPQDASPSEQTYRAKKLYLRHGSSPWPHCGMRLHS